MKQGLQIAALLTPVVLVGSCDCYVDDELVSICDIDGNPGDPCAIGFSCCHWPMSDDG